ncbi:hypothetical protein IFM89_018599 [Coptis chinensis]|uniref:Uncharacterized protein n=1 Tax=Coptis chinensis TaxID=261450 RepID=A0A835LYL0_9MAGN|nr:hypothetical protein IFM89_018599 [Coptis chinensis]
MSHLKAFFVMGFLLAVGLLISSEVAAAEAQAKNKVSFEDAKYGGPCRCLHGCCRCCSYVGEPMDVVSETKPHN